MIPPNQPILVKIGCNFLPKLPSKSCIFAKPDNSILSYQRRSEC